VTEIFSHFDHIRTCAGVSKFAAQVESGLSIIA
jgi:hypothetical protein